MPSVTVFEPLTSGLVVECFTTVLPLLVHGEQTYLPRWFIELERYLQNLLGQYRKVKTGACIIKLFMTVYIAVL